MSRKLIAASVKKVPSNLKQFHRHVCEGMRKALLQVRRNPSGLFQGDPRRFSMVCGEDGT